MKISYLTFVFCLICLFVNAQKSQPDTLELEMKTGQKIILIGKDLNGFKTIKVDSIIKKALISYGDSVSGKTGEYKRPQLIPLFKRPRVLVFQPGIGAGLIRDKISPFMGLSLDFAPWRQSLYVKRWEDEYTFINIVANAFYTFEKDVTNNYYTNTNIFLEASIGNRIFNNQVKHQFNFDEFSFGAGYLISSKGNYFKDNTYKVFISAIPNNSLVRIRSEIIFTDNFHEMFPGVVLSAKLFGKDPLFHNRHIARNNREIKKNLEQEKANKK